MTVKSCAAPEVSSAKVNSWLMRMTVDEGKMTSSVRFTCMVGVRVRARVRFLHLDD